MDCGFKEKHHHCEECSDEAIHSITYPPREGKAFAYGLKKGVHAETRRKQRDAEGLNLFSIRGIAFSTHHNTFASPFFSAPLREPFFLAYRPMQ
jgi:hypothetical protein